MKVIKDRQKARWKGTSRSGWGFHISIGENFRSHRDYLLDKRTSVAVISRIYGDFHIFREQRIHWKKNLKGELMVDRRVEIVLVCVVFSKLFSSLYFSLSLPLFFRKMFSRIHFR